MEKTNECTKRHDFETNNFKNDVKYLSYTYITIKPAAEINTFLNKIHVLKVFICLSRFYCIFLRKGNTSRTLGLMKYLTNMIHTFCI